MHKLAHVLRIIDRSYTSSSSEKSWTSSFSYISSSPCSSTSSSRVALAFTCSHHRNRKPYHGTCSRGFPALSFALFSLVFLGNRLCFSCICYRLRKLDVPHSSVPVFSVMYPPSHDVSVFTFSSALRLHDEQFSHDTFVKLTSAGYSALQPFPVYLSSQAFPQVTP